MSGRIEEPLLAVEQGSSSLVASLRAETRSDHEQVDVAFSQFDLSRRDGYAAFLNAQARVLPALEILLRPEEMIPGWQGRAALLRQDLLYLGVPPPPAEVPDIADGIGSRCGALYVMEGSRLGGAVLSGRVPAHFPKAFLVATHPPGAWRELLHRIDQLTLTRAEQSDAVIAAKSVFRSFELAARDQS